MANPLHVNPEVMCCACNLLCEDEFPTKKTFINKNGQFYIPKFIFLKTNFLLVDCHIH